MVVGSDYAGLGTPGLMSYLNSVATAHGVVDSVIASHQLDLPLSPKWAIVGQSQGGGGAAVNSARWATQFTRGTGLDYRGVVATGTPFNVESIVTQAGPQMALPPNLGPAANSYTAYILAGLRDARPPDLDIDSVLTPGRARCGAQGAIPLQGGSWTRPWRGDDAARLLRCAAGDPARYRRCARRLYGNAHQRL